MKVSYDRLADAAYIRLTKGLFREQPERAYSCDPVAVGGIINFDLAEEGYVTGIEILGARHKLGDPASWTPSLLIDPTCDRAEIYVGHEEPSPKATWYWCNRSAVGGLIGVALSADHRVLGIVLEPASHLLQAAALKSARVSPTGLGSLRGPD